MNPYQSLGLVSILFLGVAMALAGYAIFGKMSKRRLSAVSFFVLFLMILVSALSFIIYKEYGQTAGWHLR